MASPGRSRERGIFPSRTQTRSTFRIRLYRHVKIINNHRRSTFQTLIVSLCADIFQLGAWDRYVFQRAMRVLSEGLQNALWELGGVPVEHLTDRLSAAVHKVSHPDEFTRDYSRLLKHYGLRGRKTQAGKANENGDIEQRHFRFKNAVDQTLMLRGSRDFSSRNEYRLFLGQLFKQLNAGRQSRLIEEMKEVKSITCKTA